MSGMLSLPSHAGLLPKWMLITAVAAVFNSVQNYVTEGLTKQIYSNKPHLVNGLQGRTFGTWTILSAAIRFCAAYNISNPWFYGLALTTNAVAAVHFYSEWLIFRTANPGKGLFSPIGVSTLTIPWMLLQWSYYVQ